MYMYASLVVTMTISVFSLSVAIGDKNKQQQEDLKIRFDLAKYYKDSEMTAYISERSRNSK